MNPTLANALILLVCTLVVLPVSYWWVKRKSIRPKAIETANVRNATIVAQYEAPDGLLPIEVGAIYDLTLGSADVSSVIIDLAAKKYINISYLPGTDDYQISKIRNGKDLPLMYQSVYRWLFQDGNDIVLSSLWHGYKNFVRRNNTMYRLSKYVQRGLINKGYFDVHFSGKNLAAVILLILLIFVLFSYVGLLINLIGLGFYAALFFFFWVWENYKNREKPFFTPTLSVSGQQALVQILGLRSYIETAEKGRLRFDSDISGPLVFDKLLPYAMTLGVLSEWSGLLERFPSININLTGKVELN